METKIYIYIYIYIQKFHPRINYLFIYLLRTFPPHLGSFFCVVSSFTRRAIKDGVRGTAVITGDTVTRLSIPIRGRGKSPEEGQREFGRNVCKSPQ